MTRIAYNHTTLSLLTVKPLRNKGPKWGTVHTLTGMQCNVLRVWYMTLVVSLPLPVVGLLSMYCAFKRC